MAHFPYYPINPEASNFPDPATSPNHEKFGATNALALDPSSMSLDPNNSDRSTVHAAQNNLVAGEISEFSVRKNECDIYRKVRAVNEQRRREGERDALEKLKSVLNLEKRQSKASLLMLAATYIEQLRMSLDNAEGQLCRLHEVLDASNAIGDAQASTSTAVY